MTSQFPPRGRLGAQKFHRKNNGNEKASKLLLTKSSSVASTTENQSQPSYCAALKSHDILRNKSKGKSQASSHGNKK